jgi:hypothetical protein
MARKDVSIACATVLLVSQVQAHDKEGRFAVEGAGVTNCRHFVEQVEGQTKEVYAYAGWVEGYVTAVNAYQKETFDITPWQNTKLQILLLANYCKKKPDQSFVEAVRTMVQALHPRRLQERSDLVVARNGDKAIRVYEAVIRQLQQQLRKLGLYKGKVDGIYSDDVRKAVLAYQKREKLSPSGLPDASTLMRLLGFGEAQKK